jgi:hypothetical protein
MFNMNTLKQNMPAVAALVIVVTVSTLAAWKYGPDESAHAESAPPPAAAAAAHWLREHAGDVRDARRILQEHEQNKDVLDTFGCSYDWQKLAITDCTPPAAPAATSF